MYHPFYGGAEKQAHLLARRFQGFGHKVTVLTMHFGGAAHREYLDGVSIVRVPSTPARKGQWSGIIRAMMQALLELRRMRPLDVIFIHSAPFLLLPVLAFKSLHKAPVVLKMISGGVTAKSTILMTSRFRAFNPLKRRLLEKVDCFVCLNEGLVEEVKALAPAARCVYIPNGVDCDYWNRTRPMPEYKRAIGLEPDCKTAIFVGRLVPEKGVDVLLKIWKEVVAGLPKALLFIIGDGPLENELRESVERLGISGCVRFAGFQEDIRQFLFAMEAFLLFSPNEGMSNALLEAMAAGVPVICAENPGTSAIIQHMVNGVKLQAERISEAAANVRRILADPALAATISERARADVRAQFDISVTPGNMSSFF